MVWPQIYIIFELKMFVNVPRNLEPFLENVAELQLGISDFSILYIYPVFTKEKFRISWISRFHTHMYTVRRVHLALIRGLPRVKLAGSSGDSTRLDVSRDTNLNFCHLYFCNLLFCKVYLYVYGDLHVTRVVLL